MAEFEPRLISLRILGRVVLMMGLVFALVCLIGFLSSYERPGAWPVIFVISVVGAIVALASYGAIRILLSIEFNTYHLSESQNRMIKRLDQVAERLDKLNENILLSEDAKSIAFRKTDLQALRQAIEEEISKTEPVNWPR